MDNKKRRVYVCSPLNAPTNEGIRQNMMKAREYADVISDTFSVNTYATHAWLPEFMNDNDAVDRDLALSFGQAMLATCDAVFVCGNVVSSGMRAEIISAVELSIPVYSFGSDPKVIAEKAGVATEKVLPSAEF